MGSMVLLNSAKTDMSKNLRCQGQQEFRNLANPITTEQCSNINRTDTQNDGHLDQLWVAVSYLSGFLGIMHK